MINIINVNVHYDDQRRIRSLEVKLKYFNREEGDSLTDHLLVATVSAAFFKTTLLADEGKSLKTALDPKRKDKNVIDLMVNLKDNTLTFDDVTRFIHAFQKALDETSLF